MRKLRVERALRGKVVRLGTLGSLLGIWSIMGQGTDRTRMAAPGDTCHMQVLSAVLAALNCALACTQLVNGEVL